MPSRVLVTETPCPECGTSLHVVEHGTDDDTNEPVTWAPVRSYCPSGCTLTVPGLTLVLR